MNFITIIIAWGLIQHWGSAAPVHRDEWIDAWYARCRDAVSQPAILLAVVVLLPATGLSIVAGWLEHAVFGLLSLALGVAVLLYSFGRGDFAELVAGFVQRWRRQDHEGAYLYASEALHMDPGAFDGAAPEAALADINRELVYRGYERWFAVIFYYLLGGVAGALAYRLFHLLTSRVESPEERELTRKVLHVLDWVPARILMLAFAVTGNFSQTAGVLGDSLADLDSSAREQLIAGADAAMGFPPPMTETDAPAQRVSELQGLLQRSAGAWIAVIAVLTILA